MRENLGQSLELMFGHEGGYSNRKTDSGGPTKFGITHKTLAAHRRVPSVTAAEVKALTLGEAEAIYRKSYWPQSGGDLLPDGLDYAAFDFGVNSGPPQAAKTLQRVLGVKPDGWIGEQTMDAVENYPEGAEQLIRDYCDARMDFLRSLKSLKTGFPVNGRGWTIRVTGKDPNGQWREQPGVIGNALAMAQKLTKPKAADVPPAIQDEAAAKAEKPATNPWLTPEMVTTVGGGAVTAGGTVLASGLDPIRLAVAVAIIAAVALAGYFIYLRIRKTQAQGAA